MIDAFHTHSEIVVFGGWDQEKWLNDTFIFNYGLYIYLRYDVCVCACVCAYELQTDISFLLDKRQVRKQECADGSSPSGRDGATFVPIRTGTIHEAYIRKSLLFGGYRQPGKHTKEAFILDAGIGDGKCVCVRVR